MPHDAAHGHDDANQGNLPFRPSGPIATGRRTVTQKRTAWTVLGTVAELERSQICERVRAGLRNARAKGKRLGRPKVIADVIQIGRLRAQGKSWRKIARQMGVLARTCRRARQKATLGDF